MPIEARERNEIILGAVTMTGPIDEGQADWDTRLKANAKALTLMLNEKSDVSQYVTMISECKNFTGTILGIEKEERSTRGFVALRTVESKFSPDGIEVARTERSDSSPEGKALASHIRKNLVGHRVLVWIDMQDTRSGQKVRILQHVQDLGPDPEFDAEEGKQITLAKMNKR